VATVDFPIQDFMRKPGNQEKIQFMVSWVPYQLAGGCYDKSPAQIIRVFGVFRGCVGRKLFLHQRVADVNAVILDAPAG
jgi:hypothetical protein